MSQAFDGQFSYSMKNDTVIGERRELCCPHLHTLIRSLYPFAYALLCLLLHNAHTGLLEPFTGILCYTMLHNTRRIWARQQLYKVIQAPYRLSSWLFSYTYSICYTQLHYHHTSHTGLHNTTLSLHTTREAGRVRQVIYYTLYSEALAEPTLSPLSYTQATQWTVRYAYGYSMERGRGIKKIKLERVG